MPTITVQKADLYQLAGLDPELGLAELEERFWLVKGELGSRTVTGRSLRTADGGWGELEEHDQLRIELKDTNRPDLWCVEGIARQLRDHRCRPIRGRSGMLEEPLQPQVRSMPVRPSHSPARWPHALG